MNLNVSLPVSAGRNLVSFYNLHVRIIADICTGVTSMKIVFLNVIFVFFFFCFLLIFLLIETLTSCIIFHITYLQRYFTYENYFHRIKKILNKVINSILL